MGRLRSVTAEVRVPERLLDCLGDGGFAWLGDTVRLATAGVAWRGPAEEVAAGVAEADAGGLPAGKPGVGPVAVGALPFDGGGELVVPRVVTAIAADGTAWRTVVGGEAELPPVPISPRPRHFEITPELDHDDWAAMVEKAMAAIEEGRVDKVVLARAVTVRGDRPFDLVDVLRHLRAAYPTCFTFADGTFVGATPELLVRRIGDVVESRPFAGTAVAGDADLAGSEKDGREHGFVVEQVASVLGARCDDLEVADAPEVAVVGNLTHLATVVRGRLRTPGPSALELAGALHPTPAVGGTPTGEALRLIAELEPATRGRYAGPVGWVDAAGDGEWAVALRCAEVEGAVARLTAGAGIVAGSEPEAEWEETQAKLEPMLQALVRP